MTAEQSLKNGDLLGALAELQNEVRSHPDDAKLRVFLFQLLSLLGRWDRAITQLKVAGDLDPPAIAMVRTYEPAIRSELLRAEIFAGKRTPVWFGEPEEWMAFLLTALRLTAEGHHEEARAAREKAFETAPATSGTADGQRFEWIADADTRLGPVLEAIVNGRYQWIPLHRLKAIRVEAPADLRDFVWAPAYLTLSTGAEVVALIPTRYPGSEAHADPQIQLGKKTEWVEKEGAAFLGLGQRLFATDAGEHPLLDTREILLETSTPTNG